MKNKVIAVDTKSTKILDHLTEAEDMLSLYLQISKGNAPKKLSVLGFFMNPLTVLPDGAKFVAKRLEDKLVKAYSQEPITYIRLSTNLTMLQRIMYLAQPTTLKTIDNPYLKEDLSKALQMKLNVFNIKPDDFFDEFNELTGRTKKSQQEGKMRASS